MPNINFDTILSDPMLLIATALMILGPLVFLFALVKFIFTKKKNPVPSFSDEKPEIPEPQLEPEPEVEHHHIGERRNVVHEEPVQEQPAEETAPEPTQPAPAEFNGDKTVVMPSGMGEMQGQIEIVFSQIKTLNKKVYEMESEMESLSRVSATKLDVNELKEPPMNPGEFTQKLLKLAEHVIVLEKEMARMKATGSTQAPAPTAPRPPIMPI